MFFKKSREAKNTLHKEEQQTQIAAIRESLAKAEGCADPGEKLMMLEDLGKDLKKQYDTLIEKRDNGFASNSSVAGTVLSFVGGAGGAGTATVLAITKASAALAVTVTGGMLLPVFPIGLLGGAGMAILVAKTVFPIVDKADFEKNKELYVALAEGQSKVTTLTAEVMGLDLQAFASSKVFDSLYDRFPALKDRFVKEAFRKNAVQDTPIPAPPPEPPVKRTGFTV